MEVKSCRRKEGWTRGPTCSIAKSSPLANRPKTELAVASKASLPRLTPRCVMPRSIALDVVRVSAPVREGSRPERAERAVLLPLPFRQPAQARLPHLAPTRAMPPECLLRDGAAVRKGASPQGPRWPRQSCMTSPHADPREGVKGLPSKTRHATFAQPDARPASRSPSSGSDRSRLEPVRRQMNPTACTAAASGVDLARAGTRVADSPLPDKMTGRWTPTD